MGVGFWGYYLLIGSAWLFFARRPLSAKMQAASGEGLSKLLTATTALALILALMASSEDGGGLLSFWAALSAVVATASLVELARRQKVGTAAITEAQRIVELNEVMARRHRELERRENYLREESQRREEALEAAQPGHADVDAAVAQRDWHSDEADPAAPEVRWRIEFEALQRERVAAIELAEQQPGSEVASTDEETLLAPAEAGPAPAPPPQGPSAAQSFSFPEVAAPGPQVTQQSHLSPDWEQASRPPDGPVSLFGGSSSGFNYQPVLVTSLLKGQPELQKGEDLRPKSRFGSQSEEKQEPEAPVPV